MTTPEVYLTAAMKQIRTMPDFLAEERAGYFIANGYRNFLDVKKKGQ